MHDDTKERLMQIPPMKALIKACEGLDISEETKESLVQAYALEMMKEALTSLLSEGDE